MQLSKESRQRIIDAYVGDSTWLEQIEKELRLYKENELTKSDLAYDYEQFENAEKLLNTIFKMNYIIIETETEDYASKYNIKAYDLYREMKIDLTEMLGISDIWEEI